MEKSISINKEKIKGSIEVLSSIEDFISTINLAENFNDIEAMFKEINFVHANCLNYKEPLNLAYENLEYIRKRINYLTESLKETLASINQVEDITSSALLELSRIYKSTESSDAILKEARKKSYLMTHQLNSDFKSIYKEVTKIPKQQPVEDSKGINTIPIGVAIGATGVLGSLGAVAVNEIYGSESKKKESKVKLEPYVEEDEYNIEPHEIKESETPYKASREERESDRFYGNSKDEF